MSQLRFAPRACATAILVSLTILNCVDQATASATPSSFFSTVGVGLMTSVRQEAAVATLPDGKVLIAGGADATSNALSSAELFDPATGAFSAAGVGSMTVARAGAAAAPLPHGDLLIAGGDDGHGNALRSAELFDPSTDTFSGVGVGSMTTAREFAVAAPLPDGEVLIAGGSDAGNHALASAELFEPAPQAVSVGGDFGEQTVACPSAVQPLVVTNVGAQALTISGASPSGTGATDFTVTADACAGRRLAFEHSCTIAARFTPSAPGGHSAAITLQDNEAAPLSIVLSGTGVSADTGPAGAQGAAGIAGSQGSGGPQGPQGPAGARGPAGQIRLITCRTVTSVIQAHPVTHRKCTTRILSGTATFTTTHASARLLRGRTVYATGSAWLDRVVLHSRRPIGPGSYTLELRWPDGRRAITTRRRITVGTSLAVG